MSKQPLCPLPGRPSMPPSTPCLHFNIQLLFTLLLLLRCYFRKLFLIQVSSSGSFSPVTFIQNIYPGLSLYIQYNNYSINICHLYQTTNSLKIRVSFLLTAAAAAKSLLSCLTLCNPIDGSPQGSPIPGIVQARTPGWVAISFYSLLFCKISEKL